MNAIKLEFLLNDRFNNDEFNNFSTQKKFHYIQSVEIHLNFFSSIELVICLQQRKLLSSQNIYKKSFHKQIYKTFSEDFIFS